LKKVLSKVSQSFNQSKLTNLDLRGKKFKLTPLSPEAEIFLQLFSIGCDSSLKKSQISAENSQPHFPGY
jgi:hypothetical protein